MVIESYFAVVEAVFVDCGKDFFRHFERNIDADGLAFRIRADYTDVEPTISGRV